MSYHKEAKAIKDAIHSKTANAQNVHSVITSTKKKIVNKSQQHVVISIQQNNNVYHVIQVSFYKKVYVI